MNATNNYAVTMANAERIVTSIRVAPEIYDRLQTIATNEKRSLSDIMRDAFLHFTWNRDRNQRADLWAHVIHVLEKTELGDPTGPEGQEFTTRFLMQFEHPEQVDTFLSMPTAIIFAAIEDAFRKFEPTGEVPDVYPFTNGSGSG